MFTFLDGAPSPLQWLALLAAIAGLVIFAPRSRDDLLLARRGVRAIGRVAIIHYGNQNADAATIDFVDGDGRAHRFRSYLTLAGDRHFIGAELPVIYDPRYPKRAREADRPLAKLAIGALGYALIGLCLLIGLIRPLAAAVMGSLGS